MTNPALPPDHAARMDRALLALDGLSVGDALGERFFAPPEVAEAMIESRATPRAPWGYTDDTEMALSVVGVLGRHGGIDRDDLAASFARRYRADPQRGYGGTAHGILQRIGAGVPWAEAAGEVFGGTGSMGNGAAMRVAPVAAYFADDLDAAIAHAVRSAEVTHAHPEGQAGAIAVAVAGVWAWRLARQETSAPATGARTGSELLPFVLDHTPDGETRARIKQAHALAQGASVKLAAEVLGTGYEVTAPDTVPFALWCAARCLGGAGPERYPEAFWTTVAGLGDRDTTCAIVGGIVVLATGRAGIPPEWLAAREPLGLEAA